MAKKIAIVVHKGGVGKTTTAKNIAAGLASRGLRTLLVDLDEQANATSGLGFSPETLAATMNDLFANAELKPASVVLETAIPNLYLLPGHPNLGRTEMGMGVQRLDPNAPDPVVALKAILAPIEADFDYIVFDTPPSTNYMTHNALAAADEVILPVAASAYGDNGVTRTIDAIDRAISSYNPNLKLRGILITRVKRTNASSAVLDSLSERYAELVLPQAIVESTAVDEAEQLDQPVVVYAPDNVAAKGYQRIVAIVMGEEV